MEFISLNIQPHVATLLFETSRFGNGLSWLQMKDHFKTQNEKRAGFHSRTSRKEIPSAFSILLLLSLHQYHQCQWPCGSYFKVLKEALVQVPSAFSAHHPEAPPRAPALGPPIPAVEMWHLPCRQKPQGLRSVAQQPVLSWETATIPGQEIPPFSTLYICFWTVLWIRPHVSCQASCHVPCLVYINL